MRLRKFEPPFEPPWQDLGETVVTGKGTPCYIFTTCITSHSRELAAIEEALARTIAQARQKALLEGNREAPAALGERENAK